MKDYKLEKMINKWKKTAKQKNTEAKRQHTKHDNKIMKMERCAKRKEKEI